MTIISYIFGFLGVVANILIYQQKEKKKLLFLKFVSDILWAAYYGFAGMFSGMAVALIAIARETVFLFMANKKRSVPMLCVFLLAGALSSVLTWNGIASIFPAVASCLSIFSFWYGKPQRTRYLAIPISACMLTYDIFTFAVFGIANEIFTLSSTAIGLYRFRKSKEETK